MSDIKEINKKDFTRSGATKHYLQALKEGFKYLLVTNFRGFGRSFIVVEPQYFSQLLREKCPTDQGEASALDQRLSEIEGEIRNNSQARSNKRWLRDE